MKRSLGFALAVTLSIAGCKKESTETPPPARGQAPEATGGSGGQAPAQGNAPPPGQPVAPAKPAEGCTSTIEGTVTAELTLTEKCSPYTVNNEVYADTTVTIEPGTVVTFKDGAALYVGYNATGRLTVKGTAEKPVLFTAVRKEAGAWKGVSLYSHADGSTIENAVIEYAGESDAAALRIEGAGDATVKGLKIVSTRKKALFVETERPPKELSGLDLSKAGGDADALVSIEMRSLGSLKGGNTFPDKSVIATKGNVVGEIKLLAQNVPYRFLGEVYVDGPEGKTASLTLEAGTKVQVAESGAIYVGYNSSGSFKSAGTAEKPVTFTRFGDDQKATPWRGIVFYRNSRAPELEWTVLENAGRKDQGALQYEAPRGLGKLSHCTLTHVPGDGVKVVEASDRFTDFDGNTFDDIGQASVRLPIGVAHELGNNTYKSGSPTLFGNVHQDTTLKPAGVPYRLEGELYVEAKDQAKSATLTIEPGVSLDFNDQAHLYVGYNNPGKLVAKGTVEKPIAFAALENGSWKGVVAYAKGTLEIENASFANVDDGPAIHADHGSKGSVKAVTFKDVKVGVRKCGKVTTAELKAEAGAKAETKCN